MYAPEKLLQAVEVFLSFDPYHCVSIFIARVVPTFRDLGGGRREVFDADHLEAGLLDHSLILAGWQVEIESD